MTGMQISLRTMTNNLFSIILQENILTCRSGPIMGSYYHCREDLLALLPAEMGELRHIFTRYAIYMRFKASGGIFYEL